MIISENSSSANLEDVESGLSLTLNTASSTHYCLSLAAGTHDTAAHCRLSQVRPIMFSHCV